MAKVAIPRGIVGPSALKPAQRESRVIALELHAPAGIGNEDFCFTPKLGNRLWLYTIDIWIFCTNPGPGIGGFFYFTYGTGEPKSGEDVAVRWTPIIPLRCGIKPGFMWSDCASFHRHFSMARLFTNDELRFGVVVENGGAQAWAATVAFEISEG